MTSLLVVSGDRLLGEAAAAALAGEGWDDVTSVGDGLTAVATIARRVPAAVLVLGETVPRLGPVPLAQQIRRRWPDVTVVIAGAVSTSDAVVLPPSCTTADVLHALRAASDERAAPAAQARDGLAVLTQLTRRQRIVLRLLVEGLDMREIGRELGVSEHTVRTHMQNLYARLGCHSRLELVRWATAQGLLSGESGSSSG
ncbi:MAG: response regulator transcription factor [Actinomycetota bacterium]|nr:response regulator transcription factor [Actinomycetota bacterium]